MPPARSSQRLFHKRMPSDANCLQYKARGACAVESFGMIWRSGQKCRAKAPSGPRSIRSMVTQSQ
eukprot:7375888-Alexandrium_andersonii.AAC.1